MSNDTKKTRVLTADDLALLLEAAVNKIAKPRSQSIRPNIEDLRKKQEKAILNRELAQEKQEKIKKAITLEDQLTALGGDDKITPLQLVKLKNKAPQQELRGRTDNDITRQVLGQSPSTREMERLADIRLKLQGSISSNDRGEIVIDGYPVQGSNLTTAVRYLVKGSRGFKGQVPLGVVEIGNLLQQQGIASSKFPESIRPLLGGSSGRRVRKSPRRHAFRLQSIPASSQPQSSDDEVDALAEDLDSNLTINSDNSDQHGSGFLNLAMDHAENGNHDEAWDALNEARQLKVSRIKLKKVENYLSSLRDEDLYE